MYHKMAEDIKWQEEREGEGAFKSVFIRNTLLGWGGGYVGKSACGMRLLT